MKSIAKEGAFTSRTSPTLTTRAPGRFFTANHLPSFLIWSPCTSFTWRSSVMPTPSVCGERPSTLPELCGPVLHWACGEEEQIDPVQLLLLGEDEVVTEPLQAIGWDRHGHLLLQRKSEELCDVILDPLQQLPIHPMVHKLQVLHISEDY
uniref:Uncharacterized protein n=1 Tax=Oryza glumipatula TaxID=40148 RepID=A0A0E0BDP5_9ORYZ